MEQKLHTPTESTKLPPYSLAVAKNPCVIRRDSTRLAGETVLGFAFCEQEVDDLRTDTLCSAVLQGQFTTEMFFAMMNTLVRNYGLPTVCMHVTHWLELIGYRPARMGAATFAPTSFGGRKEQDHV